MYVIKSLRNWRDYTTLRLNHKKLCLAAVVITQSDDNDYNCVLLKNINTNTNDNKDYAKYELPPNTPIQVGIGIDITDIPKVRLNIATITKTNK